jgi:hypothetical protein
MSVSGTVMSKLFGMLLSKRTKKKAGRNLGVEVTDRFSEVFPQIQPRRWIGFDGLVRDGKMLLRLFRSSLNYFKGVSPDGRADRKTYESKDDYLRQEKLSPLQLQNQLQRLTLYSVACYALATAIFAYMVYIFIKVGVLDSVICFFFGLFVLANGLQFSLFVHQVKTGDFKCNVKDLLSFCFAGR